MSLPWPWPPSVLDLVEVVGTDPLQQQKLAVPAATVRDAVRRLRRDLVAGADSKPLVAARRSRLDPQNARQAEVPVGDRRMVVPRDHVAGRQRVEPRPHVAALRDRLDVLDRVAWAGHRSLHRDGRENIWVLTLQTRRGLFLDPIRAAVPF